jgi:hypothetical protein
VTTFLAYLRTLSHALIASVSTVGVGSGALEAKIDGKVVPVLNSALCHYIWGGGVCGGIDQSFLTSALDGDEWSASRPGRFISRKRADVAC